MAFVVGEVGSIILSLPSGNTAGDLGDDVGWALVRALHVAHTRPALFTLNSGADGRSHSFQWVLAWVELVGVETHADKAAVQ